jgi:hypothetical protein
MGGSEAIRQAMNTSVKITNLVTIDPVGRTGNVGELKNVGAWANVTSKAEDRDSSDLVSDIGKAIWPDSDVSGASISLVSGASHGQFSTMMKQINAAQAIDQSYKQTKKCESVADPC